MIDYEQERFEKAETLPTDVSNTTAKCRHNSGEYNKLYSQIGKSVCDALPYLKKKWESIDNLTPDSIKSDLEDVTLVLRYFRTHPGLIAGLRSGALPLDP